MAMKMFDKKNCEYKGGYIVCDDKVVCIDNEVVDLFNKLEEDIQRAKFEAVNQVLEPVALDFEFKRKTERGDIYPRVHAETPELDAMAERAMKVMDEVDEMAAAEKVNDYFDGIEPILLFVNDEFVVSGEQAVQHRFDLPTIGNPLELDKDKLSDLVIGMFR